VEVKFSHSVPPGWCPGVVQGVQEDEGCVEVYFASDNTWFEVCVTDVHIRKCSSGPTSSTVYSEKPQPKVRDLTCTEEHGISGSSTRALEAVLALWAGVQPASELSATMWKHVKLCVAEAAEHMPRRCTDREQLVAWAAAVSPLGNTMEDNTVKLVSLTFVVCTHGVNHRSRLIDTTQLLPAMGVNDMRTNFSTYRKGLVWFKGHEGTALAYQVTDVYQEYQLNRYGPTAPSI
jgi:hypothetical protein